MAEVKLTKNDLKAQRDALARFERYLPTLQLKKRQLRSELTRLEASMQEKAQAERAALEDLDAWIGLFAEPFDFAAHLQVREVQTRSDSIAGVKVPILDAVVFDQQTPDLLHSPAWVDDGTRAVKALVQFKIEWGILQQQHQLLAEELRVTSQRVNLFERVKIPETKEHIRRIQIFLGDQQTAAVVRAKIAKDKTRQRDAEDAA